MSLCITTQTLTPTTTRTSRGCGLSINTAAQVRLLSLCSSHPTPDVCRSCRYKKNLKAVYAVHPTFWLKALTWFATPFVSKKFWKKYVEISALADLFRYLPADQVTVPAFVHDFDAKTNGTTARAAAAPASEAPVSAAAASHSNSGL